MSEELNVINLNNVSIQNHKELVLENVSLKLSKGELVYLIGRTGSGKSSILKTLYADLPLISGEGFISGFNLSKIKNKEVPFLRRNLGIVFQDFQLLSDRSVKSNLEFVMKATGWSNKQNINQQINIVLEMVGLSSSEDKLPHQLSGGEQQRVAIARALVNNPDIILADEPTGNLDPEIAHEIMQLLWEISENGRAVIVATHDYGLMEKFPSATYKCENKTLIRV
jgi:cell division transport system ATP-binding protein